MKKTLNNAISLTITSKPIIQGFIYFIYFCSIYYFFYHHLFRVKALKVFSDSDPTGKCLEYHFQGMK